MRRRTGGQDITQEYKADKTEEWKQLNVYSLRGPEYILSPLSKLREQARQPIKCPPVPRKSNIGFKSQKGVTPLGNKGYLSAKYDPSIDVSYIEQMFYEIDKIGEGSYGSVYKFRSVEDDQCYAIKIIRRSTGPDKFAEIKALDIVANNKHCIHYVNAWQEASIIYIQFELALMSVADYARKNHYIQEEECWQILSDIIQALRPLHAQGYVHMDIKPDNIMVTEEGIYKLCDFGLMCDSSKTRDLDGDAKYIAQEIFSGFITPAADIFALGITVLELCLDLLLPVHGPRWHELRQCSWRTAKNNGIVYMTGELETLINWMMELSPHGRPTAKQIWDSPSLVRRERHKKPRFNYFKHWLQDNPAVMDMISANPYLNNGFNNIEPLPVLMDDPSEVLRELDGPIMQPLNIIIPQNGSSPESAGPSIKEEEIRVTPKRKYRISCFTSPRRRLSNTLLLSTSYNLGVSVLDLGSSDTE